VDRWDGAVIEVGGRLPSGAAVLEITERPDAYVVRYDGGELRFGRDMCDAERYPGEPVVPAEPRKPLSLRRARWALRSPREIRRSLQVVAWARAARRRLALEPPFAFHVAPTESRAAIACEGLDTRARQPPDPMVERIAAVHVFGELDAALSWARTGPGWDVWVVATGGLECDPDPNEAGAWRLPAVAPERLACLGEPPPGRRPARAVARAWPDQLGSPPMR